MANQKSSHSDVLEREFRRNTSIGPNGEILFDAPIEIKDQADLDNYGITWSDCRTLNFHGSEKDTVYFFKTENRAFAEYQWSYLDTQHSRGYASTRCMISGKRKAAIRCRDTNSCSACPNRAMKQAPVVSWEGLTETGWEPAPVAPVDEQVITKMEEKEIEAILDAEDKRIVKALKMKTLRGFTVKEIAKRLDISEPRVYQLLARAKAVGREYRENNG